MRYTYQCTMCNEEERRFVHCKDEPVTCSNCKGEMSRLFPRTFAAHSFPADGIYLEHVSPTGKTFYSKTEMKVYAKKHNLELGALL